MILVTGASGFIGSALLKNLFSTGQHNIKVALRKNLDELDDDITQELITNLDGNTDWGDALKDVDVVVHSAARAHIVNDKVKNPLNEFRKTNTKGTLNLAKQASKEGVSRFIFLSSIKVNGEMSCLDTPFKAEDIFVPNNPYGLSKYEAEQGLKKISADTGMEVVIIRPSLVYGPNVKANFLSMMQWLEKGIPLPLGAIHNKRSLVALDTLVDLVTTCISHPAAANQTFMVSDGEDVSTTQLLRRMGEALGKPAHLLPIPQNILATSLTLLGRASIARRLCYSLQVDITKTCDVLEWKPVISVDDALRKTAQAFLNNRREE